MLRLKQKKEDKKVAEAAEPPAAAEGKEEGAGGGDKKEIKLFNSIGGVALKSGGEAKSGRQITPGELRIQRGAIHMSNSISV